MRDPRFFPQSIEPLLCVSGGGVNQQRAEGCAVSRFRDPPALLTRPSRAPTPSTREPVAQMVEHLTFNQVVLGSSPSGLTNKTKHLVQTTHHGLGPRVRAMSADPLQEGGHCGVTAT